MSELTDKVYDTAFRRAEREYFQSYPRWFVALADGAEKIDYPPSDPEKLRAEASVAGVSVEPFRLSERAQVREKLMQDLATLCIDYALAVLCAYALLVDRNRVTITQAASDLRKHTEERLDEIRQTKWSDACERASEYFECKKLAEQKWEDVTYVVRVQTRELIEAHLRCGWLRQPERAGGTARKAEQTLGVGAAPAVTLGEKREPYLSEIGELAEMARFDRKAEQQPNQGSVKPGVSNLEVSVKSSSKRRHSASVSSPTAAARMQAYLDSNGIGQTEFAEIVGTTDRTIRNFRQTGKVRRDIFESIAAGMGTTKDALLKTD